MLDTLGVLMTLQGGVVGVLRPPLHMNNVIASNIRFVVAVSVDNATRQSQ